MSSRSHALLGRIELVVSSTNPVGEQCLVNPRLYQHQVPDTTVVVYVIAILDRYRATRKANYLLRIYAYCILPPRPWVHENGEVCREGNKSTRLLSCCIMYH